MKLIDPLIYHCPEDLQGDAKFLMNVMVNGAAGKLGPFTITQLMVYADFERNRVKETIKTLAAMNLINIRTVEVRPKK